MNRLKSLSLLTCKASRMAADSQTDDPFWESFDIAHSTLPCVFEDNSNNKFVSTCPCTVGTGDQKYDELKGESSIISVIKKQQT